MREITWGPPTQLKHLSRRQYTHYIQITLESELIKPQIGYITGWKWLAGTSFPPKGYSNLSRTRATAPENHIEP